jgi:hypothetical protein
MSGFKTDRLWMAGGATGALVIVAIAWFFAAGPELSNASALDSQTLSAQSQNLALQSKIRRLQDENANMSALTASLQQARTALPTGAGLADYTQQLSQYASQLGVSITSITAGLPTPATSAGQKAVAAHGASAAGQLFALPVTVVIKGKAADDLRFLSAIQGTDKRAALVSAAQLTSDATKAGGSTQLTAQLQLFVAPQSPANEATLQKELAGTGK